MMLGKGLYIGTGVLALVVGLVCTMFSLAAGLGVLYLALSGAAVLLVIGGLILSPGEPRRGAVLSGCGTVLCAFALLGGLVELISAIPFRQQPGQATMLIAPMLLLGFVMLHALVALLRWRGAGEV